MSEEVQNEQAAVPNPPELKPGTAKANGAGDIDIDMLMDVSVSLTVEVGRKKMAIKELLGLTQGSVVSFDRIITEPMDIMVNGTLIARGEVVSAEGQFGLRLVDVVSPQERLKQLG